MTCVATLTVVRKAEPSEMETEKLSSLADVALSTSNYKHLRLQRCSVEPSVYAARLPSSRTGPRIAYNLKRIDCAPALILV